MEIPDDAVIYHRSIYHGWKLWYRSKIDGSTKITYSGPEMDLSDRGLRRALPDFLKLLTKEKIEWHRFLEESTRNEHDGLPEYEEVKLWDDDEIAFAQKNPGRWKRKIDARGTIRKGVSNQDQLTQLMRQQNG